jgi:hypothetical protein
MTLPYLSTFVIIPPLKRTWTFIWITWISIMQEMFVPSLIEIGLMFHFKRFFPTHKFENSFPSCVPLPSGIIICTSLNLYYLRKLSCKYELFWLSGLKEKLSLMTLSNFCIFVISSPLKRTWPFIKVWLKLACWFWRRFFSLDINTSENGFLIVAPPDPRGPWFEEAWIYIISEALK